MLLKFETSEKHGLLKARVNKPSNKEEIGTYLISSAANLL